MVDSAVRIVNFEEGHQAAWLADTRQVRQNITTLTATLVRI